MSLKKNKDLKLYFSISEVAQMFDVNESTLRFWEKEIRPNTSTQDRQRNPLLSAGRHRRNTLGLPLGERKRDDTGGCPAKAEREPGDNDTPRRDRKQVETDQGRIACHEGSIRSVGSIQIALTP